MEKIKKIFSPGHKTDDDVMYGSGDQTASNTTGTSGTTGTTGTTGNEGYSLNSDPLYANSAADNESGVKRQILNPGNEKYDEHRFNNTTGETGSRPAVTGTTGASNTTDLPERAATGTNDSNLGRDTAIAGGVGSASHRGEQDRLNDTTGNNDRSFPLSGGNTTTGNTGIGNTTGTHDSHLGRDAAVAGGVGTAGYEAEKHHHGHHHGQTGTDSNIAGGNTGLGSGSNTTGTHNSHLGRDAAVAGGVGTAGYEAEKHHHGHHHGQTGTDSNLAGGNTGLGSGSNTTGTHNSHHLGRDAAVAGGVGAAGYEAEKHHHHHDNTAGGLGHDHAGHGHQFGGDPCPPGQEAPVTGAPHHFSGPHATDTANRLDPHVPGEFPTQSGQDSHHLGRDAAVGGVGAAGLGAYEADKHHNRGLDNTSSTSGSQPLGGSSSTHGRDHHLGRDAALAGGAGLGAREAEKHHHQHEAPFSGAGAYNDQRYDPSATSGTSQGLRSGEQGSSIGYPSSTSNPSGVDPRVNPQAADSQKSHHFGRDAALAGGAGAVGAGAYEADKHHHNTGATGTTGQNTTGYGSSTQPTSSQAYPQGASTGVAGGEQPRDHHYGRDAALAGGAGALGAGAYEADKHHHNTGATGTTGQNTTGYGSQVNNHGASTGVAGGEQSRDHHYGRDAALAGGAGALGAGAYEADKHHDSSRLGAQSTQQPLATPTGAPNDARVFDQTQRVPQSNQAAAGWATDTKEQEKLAKQHDKEMRKEEKHHDKALAKEEKHHDKALAKEEKKEDKALAKEEKKEDKALAKEEKKEEKQHNKALAKEEKREEKEEKKQEKALAKEEKKEEKEEKHEKKGGLLGFLHKNKNHDDENTKTGQDYREEDQAAHLRHQQQLERDAAAGTAGVAGAEFEPSVRDQQHDSRVSADQSGHNRLHKDPSAKVQNELEQRAAREQGTTGSSSIPQSAIGSGEDRFVTDPHTGLEMNVGKYGSGTGGTDGSSTVPGYRAN